MNFLDPKTDIAFKKLFANNQHKDILICFLNSILQREEGKKITEVEILDPNNNRETEKDKHSIVDVRCKDQSNRIYILEMQLMAQKDYAQRSQYYAALAMARQLKSGYAYEKLNPVIFVGVLCFELFKSKEYLSHHLILNTKTHEHGLQHLEFHFIELPKFDKKLKDLKTVEDKWIYLLKNAEDLKIIPSQFKKPEEIEEAMIALEQGTWSDADFYKYEKHLDAIRTEKSVIKTAREEALQQVAIKMLKKHSLAQISEATGLSIKEIEGLKKKSK